MKPDYTMRTVQRCQKVIRRVAGHLIQEKKAKIDEGLKSGVPYAGRDLLSLLRELLLFITEAVADTFASQI